MNYFSILKKNNLNDKNQEAIDVNNKNNSKKKVKFKKSNSFEDLISEEMNLYDKSDYENTLRLGSIFELDNEIETNKDKNNKLKVNIEDKQYKSQSTKILIKINKNEKKIKKYLIKMKLRMIKFPQSLIQI